MKLQRQIFFYSKTKYAFSFEQNPSPKMCKNSYQKKQAERPRFISEANSIPIGRAQESISKFKSTSVSPKKNCDRNPWIKTPHKEKAVYIPPHWKNDQTASKKKVVGNPKRSFSDKNTNCEEIIISNSHSEEKWKDCEDKGIYMYWNGPSRKRSRLVHIISKIWGDKVSNLNSFVDKIWLILCRNA